MRAYGISSPAECTQSEAPERSGASGIGGSVAGLAIEPVRTISETWWTSTNCGCGPQGQGVTWALHPDRAHWA
ncbi:hypothetical protein GCM10010335_36970 [Streptomyces galbus]|nr:hypothetical protein GCM10010335_36970 [Streptomyces galbus]